MKTLQVVTELPELRLQGMVGAWTDLTEQDGGAVAASQWLIEHLLQAEHAPVGRAKSPTPGRVKIPHLLTA